MPIAPAISPRLEMKRIAGRLRERSPALPSDLVDLECAEPVARKAIDLHREHGLEPLEALQCRGI